MLLCPVLSTSNPTVVSVLDDIFVSLYETIAYGVSHDMFAANASERMQWLGRTWARFIQSEAPSIDRALGHRIIAAITRSLAELPRSSNLLLPHCSSDPPAPMQVVSVTHSTHAAAFNNRSALAPLDDSIPKSVRRQIMAYNASALLSDTPQVFVTSMGNVPARPGVKRGAVNILLRMASTSSKFFPMEISVAVPTPKDAFLNADSRFNYTHVVSPSEQVCLHCILRG